MIENAIHHNLRGGGYCGQKVREEHERPEVVVMERQGCCGAD